MADLPYSTQWLDADDIAAVTAVLGSAWLTTGPVVDVFEAALAEVCGAPHAVVVNSGTAALHAAYAAAGLRAGDAIVTSPLTFVATASAALMLGATVRFADVDPGTGNLDPDAAEGSIDAATRLIVGVDFAGHPADYEALRRVGGSRTIVADAAHSLGASAHGRPVGSLADLTCFSFHPVKSITSGEGGAVLTGDAGFADAIRRFRNHGIVRDANATDRPAWYYEVRTLGMNYRLPDILCALGLSQLGKLGAFVARRQEIAARYAAALGGVAALELPVERPGIRSSWHLYVVRVRDAARRDAFYSALREEGLNAQVHYIPVYRHPLFADLGYRSGQCPVAEDYADRAVSIPLYPKMSDADVDRVVTTVRRVAGQLL